MFGWLSEAGTLTGNYPLNLNAFRNFVTDTTLIDTTTSEGYRKSRRPDFRPKDRVGDPFSNRTSRSPLLLKNPDNVNLNVDLDDSLRYFEIKEKVGDLNFRNPTIMTYEEYTKYQQQQAIRNYWRSKAEGGVTGEKASGRSLLSPKIPVVSPLFNRIFGGDFVDIQTNGNAGLKFGARFSRNFNQSLPLRRQRTGDFEFDQNLAINVTGRIGEKLKLNFNWDTKANFEFENNIKMDYTGFEEEIIRKIEAGNVSLPLNNSLISGAQNLFGVKAQLQFGRLGVTTVMSNVRGRTDQINIQNGAQNRPFEIKVDQYERDRHYFLSQFFRDRYDRSLRDLPQLKSGITIRRLEVYITNDNRSTENLRNVVTLMDLAEADTTKTLRDQFAKAGVALTAPSSNDANNIYSRVSGNRNNNTVDETLQGAALLLQKTVDFEHVRARRLDPKEYKFNAELGYISLNIQMLPEQVLGVAYEYTLNGRVYRVGELQDDYQNVNDNEVIFLKMLKSTNPALSYPTWDLMMKNVYSLNANQITREGFQMNIIYKDDETGVDITSLKEGRSIQNVPLVEVFNLDKVNTNNDAPPDGNFDFLTGLTIDPENGRIFFPEVEPFGSYLQSKFVPGEENLVQKYVYQELYDQTQSDAQQITSKSKFFLKGRYQASATDEIALPGIQVAEGSVRVRSGGNLLTEGVDYRVDYALGRVKILNPSYLNSASNLAVEFEKAEIINPQPRAMVGARFDYALSRDIGIGATLLHLGETPYNNNRVSLGDEPSNNTIYGLDINLKKESRLLTTLTDKLPFIQTKEPSAIAFNAEFAQLLPARSKLKGEDGVSYIDDFEGAESSYSLSSSTNTNNWRLAATPAPLIGGRTGRAYADNRAHLAWYTIDQGVYYRNGNQHPNNITDGDLRNHYIRGINRKEIFPNRDLDAVNNYEYPFDLVYYPAERGQYNYNPNATDRPDAPVKNGKLLPNFQNPIDNWAGISREITFDTDFDNANIEYLEFWMMDPFLQVTNPNTKLANITDQDGNDKANTTGGELVFNLGNVSEDLLKDQNRYEFENGLPTEASTGTTKRDTDPTDWGVVTRRQFLTDAFDNNSGSRQFQDIGLEGLNNSEEKQFFTGVYQQFPDPSNDDFRHHLNQDYDNRDVKILGRYKYFNGMENNSAENSVEAAYAYPDKEDLNKDNIVSDVESYYEYKIDLRPGKLAVGQNYIVDRVTTSKEGDSINWYLFRIPVRQPTSKVNNIQGFKSIRFMRMYLTKFQEPVVLRTVQMQFVSNQWRKYLGSVSDGGVPCTGNCDTDVENFTVSTVNLEENGEADPGNIKYVIPPGIYRQFDNSSVTTRRQNEQSLQICVDDLKDSFGKAVYKNVTMDMLIYKRLKLFIHAQSLNGSTRDDEVRAFIRIGTDYTQNYYEYSLPLKMTRNGETAEQEIWKVENMIDVAFQDFINAKAARNQAQASLLVPFPVDLPDGRRIVVVGNPDFSSVQGIMLGVLNPKSTDRADKSFCVWADELRVADFDKKAGWAANARANIKLADLANISATGSYTTVGFGSLQEKIAQRARSNTAQFDVNANITADKFLPERLGIRIPVAVQYGKTTQEPRYDPLDPDTPLEQSLKKFTSDEARREYRKKVVNQTTTKSFNLLNVRKEKTDPDAKSRPYDIENVSLSYAYSELLHTDIFTQKDLTKTYTGGFAYTFNGTPKNYTPLSKVAALKSPYLKFLQEFNFTPLPSRVSFRADLDRRYNELFLQRRTDPNAPPQPLDPKFATFQKTFFFNRVYDLKWDLTKSLSFDYTATNRSVVDEPRGQIDSHSEDPLVRERSDVIWKNLYKGGRTTNFDQSAAVTYRLPLDKFPLTDWVSADARYAAGYTWTSGSTVLISDTLGLGNTIQNNSDASVTGKVDLMRLYNKVKFLKAINEAPATAAAGARPPQPTVPGAPAAQDTTEKKPELKALKATLKVLMAVQSINFTYQLTRGNLIPGYLPKSKFFGFDEEFSAPGLPFILGKQFPLSDLYDMVDQNGWYTDSSHLLNTPFSGLRTENFSARTNVVPFKNFNIQVEARRERSDIEEAFYRLTVAEGGNKPLNNIDSLQSPLHTGSFSTSIISLGTMFESRRGNNSQAFDTFIANRQAIAEKLAAANPDKRGVYNNNSQDVLIPAFMYAYLGKDVGSYNPTKKAERSTNLFKSIPLPNWRVDYNGLAELPFIKQYFSSFSLTHAYSSVYSINSFSTSLQYKAEPETGFSNQINAKNEFIPYYVISQVTLMERLTPLLGINFKTQKNVIGRIEYRTERNLALNMTNAQVTEVGIKDYVIGLGYATTNFRVPFKINGERIVLKNELNARFDFTLRDNITIQRSIISDSTNTGLGTVLNQRSDNVPTNGTKQIQIKPTIDYTVNQKLNIQFYFTRVVSEPKISSSFKNTVSEGGIQLRYSLSQ
ncbi:cell surface protein SprA [Adhaeribacter radiodurans]|uniref:Cell surface protein SprA n=1 Tax=Adhaeribacter radiodurans TaxID=2745197 RepID=A0A7L7LFR3_9BACT|nr:cell surface protein SprA [Adhaeribacter radiodurans]